LKKGHFDDDEDTILRSAMEGHHSDVVDEATWNGLASDMNRAKETIKRRWTMLEKQKVTK
jgi:hypothetical protein